jgi:hypothetical protein
MHTDRLSLRLVKIGFVAKSLLAAAALLACFGLWASPAARADDSCDTSEQVACIPISAEGAGGAGGASTSISSGANAPAAAAAVPVLPPLECDTGPCPAPVYCPGPLPLPAGTNAPNASAVPIAPVPVPSPCFPYRSIFTTINLGNAADVRALRTLSTDALRPYWRGQALRDIQAQIDALQASGLMANARLISIQVQSRTIDGFGGTARVRTLEHWQLDERSLDDGSLVVSQDEWVRNDYSLTLQGSGWYITGDTMSVLPGPFFGPFGG